MSTSGDHGAFACHVTTAVIFDQLACHGACMAKLRVVSERRGSDEDEHQGQAFYQDHLISCPALGRAKDYTGPITECGSAATKTRSSNTTRQVAEESSACVAIGAMPALVLPLLRCSDSFGRLPCWIIEGNFLMSILQSVARRSVFEPYSICR